MQPDDLHSDPQYDMRVTMVDGLRITTCPNRYEIVARADCWINEQQTIQALRQWIKKRHERLREPGDLSK